MLKCLKFFQVGGVALITFGALFYNGYKTYETILPDLGMYTYPPILMMVAGAIIVVISFMGCCGTLRESKGMMVTYATLLVVVLLVEVAIAVVIFTNQTEVKDLFRQQLKGSIANYKTQPDVKEVWDTMQANVSVTYWLIM
jgi:hypothetical protein